MPPLPEDQSIRQRFIHEIDRNFSVIAPAGVGKTTSIVSRVVNIVKEDLQNGTEHTRKLILVTYTVKAAEEMRLRARNEILTLPDAPRALSLLNEAFFGTIHSLGLRLLRKYGGALGLPSKMEMISDQGEQAEQLWEAFIRERDILSADLPPGLWWRLLRHVQLEKVLTVAKKFPVAQAVSISPPGTYIKPDFSEIYALPLKGNGAKNIKLTQLSAQDFEAADREFITGPTHDFIGFPDIYTTAKDAVAAYKRATAPLFQWFSQATLHAASRISISFQQFLIRKGLLRFNDIIELANRLHEDPAVALKIRAEGFSIILDEAQDTDPDQFSLLLGLVTDWKNRQAVPGGRFTMVGDPQQSIYSERANNALYLEIDRFINNGTTGERLEFVVTFRCARRIIDFVNESFSQIFNSDGGPGRQVGLTPLVPRPNAPEGKLKWYSLDIINPVEGAEPKGKARAKIEAKAFAQWLTTRTPEDFDATDWKDVAILCPRKEWLEFIYDELRELQFPVQSFSRKKNLADDPPFAWATALIDIMAQPENAFEIAGVLREIYGIKDDSLARFCRGADLRETHEVNPLQILTPTEGEDEVATILNELHTIRKTIYELPLREAIAHLFHAVSLKERLIRLFPSLDYHVQRMLENITLLAGEAENDKERWLRFLRYLRQRLNEEETDSDVRAGHLQLISCHKSKGLQWQTVVLPFLERKASGNRTEYPDLLQHPLTQELSLAMSGVSRDPDLDVLLSTATLQSFERLLYVALTRAKNNLVLVDGSIGSTRAGGISFSQILKENPDLSPIYERYREECDPEPISYTVPVAMDWTDDEGSEESEPTASVEDFSEETISTDIPPYVPRTLSPEPITRITPSSLAHHQDYEPESNLGHEFIEEAERAAKAGAAYGHWWHLTMELFPWDQPQCDLATFWRQREQECPQTERGRREWELFLNSSLLDRIWKPGFNAHPEAQLFWPREDGTVYDGIVDLTVYDANTQKWLIIDWKTDFLPGDDINHLAQIYSPQVGVYKLALQEIYGIAIETILYSTRKGETVTVKTPAV